MKALTRKEAQKQLEFLLALEKLPRVWMSQRSSQRRRRQ